MADPAMDDRAARLGTLLDRASIEVQGRVLAAAGDARRMLAGHASPFARVPDLPDMIISEGVRLGLMEQALKVLTDPDAVRRWHLLHLVRQPLLTPYFTLSGLARLCDEVSGRIEKCLQQLVEDEQIAFDRSPWFARAFCRLPAIREARHLFGDELRAAVGDEALDWYLAERRKYFKTASELLRAAAAAIHAGRADQVLPACFPVVRGAWLEHEVRRLLDVEQALAADISWRHRVYPGAPLLPAVPGVAMWFLFVGHIERELKHGGLSTVATKLSVLYGQAGPPSYLEVATEQRRFVDDTVDEMERRLSREADHWTDFHRRLRGHGSDLTIEVRTTFRVPARHVVEFRRQQDESAAMTLAGLCAVPSKMPVNSIVRTTPKILTVTHHGITAPVPDVKGMAIVAHLLARPGVDVDVLSACELVDGAREAADVSGVRQRRDDESTREVARMMAGCGDEDEKAHLRQVARALDNGTNDAKRAADRIGKLFAHVAKELDEACLTDLAAVVRSLQRGRTLRFAADQSEAFDIAL